MLKASNLAAVEGVRHGFFTRRGGVSRDTGTGGLNCGFGADDDPENVMENRRRAMERMGAVGGTLVTAYQVHSARAVAVEAPWRREDAPQADALASGRTDVVLGILTADCAPVLFADGAARVVGAAHAGWRGARAGVLEACVAEMVRQGAEPARITAAVGPCIAQPSYEVGAEFRDGFVEDQADNEAFFIPARRDGHFLFDLAGYVQRQLTRLGLASVDSLGVDTCAEEERFYSYRRSTLNGEKDYGRLLSAIALED